MTDPSPEVSASNSTSEQRPPLTEQPADAFTPDGRENAKPDAGMDAPADPYAALAADPYAALAAEPDAAPEAHDVATADERQVWDRALADRYRAEWRELQMRFVDDPRGATQQAAGLVEDAVQALMASLRQRARAIAEQNSGTDDTESQLSALRDYRALFNRVLES
jgi:hypothetical protein